MTDEERQAAGAIVELAIALPGMATLLVKASAQIRVATQIFRRTASACDKISKIGRAMKSFKEAGKVLNGTSDVQSSVRGILDNYCFVGTVDVTTYDMGNRWATVAATRVKPLAATPPSLRSDVSAGWIIIGAGAVALLQVFSGRTARRNSEEREEAWPELAWV